jgi:hypothetical protein
MPAALQAAWCAPTAFAFLCNAHDKTFAPPFVLIVTHSYVSVRSKVSLAKTSPHPDRLASGETHDRTQP